MPPDRPITTSVKPFLRDVVARARAPAPRRLLDARALSGGTPAGASGGRRARRARSAPRACRRSIRPSGSASGADARATSTSTTNRSSTNWGARATQRRRRRRRPWSAVEDQLVLAADLVDVDDRAAGVGGPGRRASARARRDLAGVVRRGVDVDDQLGARRRPARRSGRRAPGVLADADADPHAADHEQLERLGPGREVALLVEHRVVGQRAACGRCRRTAPSAQTAAAL